MSVSAVTILEGDCLDSLRSMPAGGVRCCVTSPPYWGLRDYGFAGQIGLEPTPGEYVARLVDVFREVRRVLADDATLWLNLGDSYAGNGPRSNNNGEGASSMGWPGQRKETLNKAAGLKLPAVEHGLKPKDLCGIPWRVAFALQADGWYLRSDIIWAKPNPMPESVTDRPTKAHEYVFLLAKSERYHFDADAVAESALYRVPAERHASGDYSQGSGRNDGGQHRSGGFVTGEKRNVRSVWSIATQPYDGAHFATFPEALAERCIRAGSAVGDTVLDPFGGSGTTGAVALRWGRRAVLCEGNPEYVALARKRIAQADAEHGTPLFDGLHA